MSVLSRPTALLAGFSVAVALVGAPGVAYAADTTTKLTAAQMSAAMRSVAAASTTAGAGGWKATIDYTLGSQTGSATAMVDPVTGRLFESFQVAGFAEEMYAAEGSGVYRRFDDATSLAAVTMMGRPSVRYAFAADKTRDLQTLVEDYTPSPASVAVSYDMTATRTAHDDGSVDYRVTEDDAAVTLTVAPDGTLAGAHAVAEQSEATLVYTYAPQTVMLPAAARTVGEPALAGAVAYLDMAASVRETAVDGAAATRKATAGRKVQVAQLRKKVRSAAASVNSDAGTKIVKVKNVTGGVRVYATNPWTKETVAYTVKASGKKVKTKRA